MRKLSRLMMIFSLTVSLCSCDFLDELDEVLEEETTQSITEDSSSAFTAEDPIASSDTASFSSPSDITLEHIISASTPEEILKQYKVFSITSTYENTGDEMLEGASIRCTFAMNEKGYCEFNDSYVFKDGYTSNTFYTADPADKNYYILAENGNTVESLEEDYASNLYSTSLLGYTPNDLSLLESNETSDSYIITIQTADDSSDVITVDPKTGSLMKIISTYPNKDNTKLSTCTVTFDYSSSQSIDYSPKEANTDAVSEAETMVVRDSFGNVSLEATDINGNQVTNDILSGTQIVLLNFWEPWCGPCVGEMPDLEKLYEDYKKQGLLVVGVYATFSQDSEAKSIVKENNITYPILRCTNSLATLQQDYVPATYLLDGNGNILTKEPFIGSRSYKEWEKIIKEYLP